MDVEEMQILGVGLTVPGTRKTVGDGGRWTAGARGTEERSGGGGEHEEKGGDWWGRRQDLGQRSGRVLRNGAKETM